MRIIHIWITALVLLGCSTEAVPPRSDAFAVALHESVCLGEPIDLRRALELEAGAYALSIAERAVFECVLEAADCAGVLGCYGIVDRGDCDADTDTSSCEGDTRVTCTRTANGDRWRAQICGQAIAGDIMCVMGDDGEAYCGSGTCDSSALAMCDGIARLSVCIGAGVQVHQLCSRGTTCRTIDGTDGCSARGGRACLQDQCEGDVFVSCPGGVTVDVVIDCSRYLEGGACGMDDVGLLGCIVPEPECTPGASECIDSMARVCIDGVWQETDCRAFLGASCRAEAGAPARCAL